MADITTTSPADMDPIQQAGVAGTISNIKNFGHAPDLILNTLMTNMATNQQAQFAFQQAIQSRCINLLLDPMSTAVGNVALGQQAAKESQTTPPDTSGALASLSAQLSMVVQSLQGLSLRRTTAPAAAPVVAPAGSAAAQRT